jgi:protein phosphatase
MSAEGALSPDVALSQVRVDVAARSHRGKVRLNNEDHYLVAAFQRSMKALLTSLPEGEIPFRYGDTGYGMVVADGMGGVAGGEVASRTVISVLIELALSTPDWIMRFDSEFAKEVLHRLNDRIMQAEAALIEKARIDPALTGMGTTVTIACSIGASLLIAHVGDSRAYLFRKGGLEQLTCDHTVAQALYEAGVIDPEAVQSHPMRHLLTRVVGGSEGDRALADLAAVNLIDGDQVLLCTDGLTDMVSEERIAGLLAMGRTADQACHALIETALEGGGRDNITAVVARYRIPT